MPRTMLRIEEVAVLVGVSVKTINNWYAFKKAKPHSMYAKMIPDFVQVGARQARYWDKSSINKLIEFKQNLPRGRNGAMGCVTQKYLK